MLHSSHRRRALFAAAPFILAACDAPAPVELPARPIDRQVASRATVFEPEFDRYTAKVVVTMTGGGITRLPPAPERKVEYGIERALEHGVWTTTYDFAGVRDAGKLRRMPIRKVVQGPDGLRFLDHNGNVIPLRDRFPAATDGIAFPDFTAPRPAPGAPRAANPRAWASGVVSDRAQGLERRAQLAAAFAPAPGKGRTVRFSRQRNGQLTEIVLDTSRGTIEEMRTLQRGRVTAHTTFEYQDLGDDRWLKVRAVQRQEDPAGGRHPLTVEHLFVDQRFHRMEGR